MKKTSLMNGVTVAAYAAMAVYLMVVLITLGIWVTGGFKKYTAEAGGLKFDCMAVSIADNAGSANVKVLSDNATTTLNLSSGTIGYNDPSVPIEIKLELRDQNNRIIPSDEAIVEIPEKVMLGETFEVSAILDLDGYNKGGDCYLYAYSMDDMLYANPLHIFVDVPIESASLMYYNINSNLNQNFKRIVETEIEGQDKPLRTTLFYKNANDYNNNVNAIMPLNRELKTQNGQQVYSEIPLSCVKGDQFQLYVQVWPERSLNPHKQTNTSSISSSVMLKNLDAAGLANICTLLMNEYDALNKDDDEAVQNYVEQFEKVWSQLGLNNYVNLNGLITKNKINQAITRLNGISSYDITNYYTNTLGSTIVFEDKNIAFETQRRDVAEVDEASAILTIKSEPRNASDASVNVNVSPVYGDTLNGVVLFKAFVEEDNLVDVEITSDFEVGSVYFVGIGFEDGVSKSSISSQLVSVLNVSTQRLVLSAQQLTPQDKAALLSTNGLTQSELDSAVNLSIVINTQGNNAESNPTPLISEMKNLNLVQKALVNNSPSTLPLPLNIIADNTTLGDTNKVWIITANRRLATESNETLYLELSLTQEIKVADLEEPDIDELGNMVTTPYIIEGNESVNSLVYKAGSENTIAQKTSSIDELVFEIKIEKPTNMQYKRNVNIEFTKYDDGRNKDIGTPVNMSSLMMTFDEDNPYIPENYTYGKIIYVVNDTSTSVINTTASGLLYYSYASANDSDDVRYGYIEPMGAGTVTITPYLVMTEREDGIEYAIRYDAGEEKYVRINMSEASEADFVIVDTYNTITIKVTERIVSFTYYLDEELENECLKNDPNTYFATGANNKLTLYVRANSSRALPGTDTEYQGLGYSYSYRVTTGGQSTNDLNISYPENSANESNRFITLPITVGETQIEVNCMVIEITVNPLVSTDNRVYTITWYKGTEEIPDSQIYINAKDYFGTQQSLSFKKNQSEKQQIKEYTAKFVKDDTAGEGTSRYLVKWNNGETDSQMLTLPDVYYLATNNTGSEPYIQTTLYPSITTTATVFYWIRDPVYDGEGNPTYSYDVMNVSNTYFTITETTQTVGEGENEQTETVSTLYIKDFIPNNALGVRIGYRYNPGVTLDETIECDYDIFLNWPVLEYGIPSTFTVDTDLRKVTVTLPPMYAKTNTLVDYNVTLDVSNDTIIIPQDSLDNYAVDDLIRIYEGSTLIVSNAKITGKDTKVIKNVTYGLLQLQPNTLSNIELNSAKQCHIYKLTTETTFVEDNVLLPAWRVVSDGFEDLSDPNENYVYTMTANTSVNLGNLTTIQMQRALVLRFKIPTSGNGFSDKSNYTGSVLITKQTS